MKTPIIALMIILLLPIIAQAELVEYSLDNSTWQNATIINNSTKEALILGLNSSTLYHIRASNDSGASWIYSQITTGDAGMDNSVILMIGLGIFGFMLLMMFKFMEKEHWLFKLIIIFFIPMTFVSMGGLGISVSTGTNYENNATTFYKVMLWFIRLFYAYVFGAFIYSVLSHFKIIKPKK